MAPKVQRRSKKPGPWRRFAEGAAGGAADYMQMEAMKGMFNSMGGTDKQALKQSCESTGGRWIGDLETGSCTYEDDETQENRIRMEMINPSEYDTPEPLKFGTPQGQPLMGADSNPFPMTPNPGVPAAGLPPGGPIPMTSRNTPAQEELRLRRLLRKLNMGGSNV
jgi:hypothetical protein